MGAATPPFSAAGCRGNLSALACFVARRQGEELADFRVHIGLGDAQGGSRGLDVRIVVQGAIDQAVERGRVEHLPPFGRQFAADVEMLRLVLRRKRRGLAIGRVTGNIRWFGGLKIGPDAGVKAQRGTKRRRKPELRREPCRKDRAPFPLSHPA